MRTPAGIRHKRAVTRTAGAARRRPIERATILIDSLPNLVWVLGASGDTTQANGAFSQFFGLAPEQAALWRERLHPQDAADFLAQVARGLQTGQPWRGEVRAQRADQQWRWLECWAQPKDQGLVIAGFDVTERKEVERQLRVREEQLRFALDATLVGHWSLDLVNDQAYRTLRHDQIFGYDRLVEDWGFDRFLNDHVIPADRDFVAKSFERAVADGAAWEFECRIRRVDGALRWIWAKGRSFLDADDRPQQMVGLVMDITERKEAELRLRVSEERLRRAAEAAGFATYELGVGGGPSWASAELWALLGRDVAPGEDVAAIREAAAHPDDRPRLRSVTEEAIAGAQAGHFEMEYRVIRPDGEVRWVADFGRAFTDEAGGEQRVIGTLLDITASKSSEQALREAGRRKDEFIAMLGHELRNPLASIRAATELLERLGGGGSGEAGLLRIQRVLDRQSQHMVGLIDGLLDVTRITRGKISLNTRTLDLREVVRGVAGDRDADLRERGLTLTLDLPPEPAWVLGDEVRLVQILDNLVGNAIKFTPQGGTVGISVVAGDPVRVAVTDTGAGIELELQTRLFEPFQQGRTDLARRGGGLGLGLALCKALVELHAGTVRAHSAGPDRGATFEVTLPGAPAAPPPRARREPDATVPSRRVLIVEDNQDAGTLLLELLELRGHQVSMAATGEDALQRLRRQSVDLVLCDLGLPDMSGYDVARRVRQELGLSNLPLVAVTGYGQEDARQRATEAGFDAHLVKPVELKVLDGLMAQLTAAPAG